MDKYDVAIVGGGIGGLVCGAYLAKAGLKVCIIEKNAKIGGYCTSFVSNNYKFDSGIHYLGGIKKGLLGKILQELDLKDKIQFNQFDPADTILTPDNKTHLRANPYDTIQEFKRSFPAEENNIENFFNFVMQEDFLTIYKKIRKVSFGQMLDSFFNDINLRKIFEDLFWITFAVSASELPALIAVATWRHFFLDPGYYPEGGIETLANIFASEVKKHKGDIFLSKEVTRMFEESNDRKTIVTDDGSKISARYIVANIDPFQLSKMIVKQNESYIKSDEFIPSLSAIVIYLGLNYNLHKFFKNGSCIWTPLYIKKNSFLNNYLSRLVPHEDATKMLIFSPSLRDDSCISSNNHTLQVFFPFPYIEEKIEKQCSNDIYAFLIKELGKVFPSLEKHIVMKTVATPITFYKQTFNTGGAILGKKISMQSNKSPLLSSKLSIKGLFVAGSWYSYGGVNEAAISGKGTAEAILHAMGKKHEYKVIKL